MPYMKSLGKKCLTFGFPILEGTQSENRKQQQQLINELKNFPNSLRSSGSGYWAAILYWAITGKEVYTCLVQTDLFFPNIIALLSVGIKVWHSLQQV